MNSSPGRSEDHTTGVNGVKDIDSPAEMALYDINDDCLLIIFRMLSLDDLLWVADTCSRFRTLAVKVFTLTHSRVAVDFNTWYNDDTKTFNMLHKTSNEIWQFNDWRVM